MTRKAKPIDSNNEQLVQELIGLTETLLKANWGKIDKMREGQDGKIGVSMAYRIEYEGNERALKATIAFGERIRDSRETVIDPNQSEMFIARNPDGEM